MENSQSFYICLYRGENGKNLGHALSNSADFPEKISKNVTIDQVNVGTNFGTIFDLFCESMLGYMDILPFIAIIGSVITDGIQNAELTEFCESNSVNTIRRDQSDIFEIGVNNYSEYRSIEVRRKSAQLVSKQVPKMLLIGIVGSLDHYLAQIMKEILKKFPAMISDSDKTISVRDIFKSGSLEEFKDFLLDREIESVTRSSFEDQIDWIEKRLNIARKINDDYANWLSLIEVIERRNLFAHANGLVNDIYIKSLNASGSEAVKMKKGDELFASPKYFKASLDNICEFGVKILQVSWRKLHQKETALADDSLGDFGYKLIERGEYKLASAVLDFAVNGLRGKTVEARRRMDIVNLANAYKLDGREAEAMKTLDAEDWTIVSDQFAISVAAIRGDIATVLSYMRRLSQSGEWDGNTLEEWPVFVHVRDDLPFRAEFEKLFGRKYVPQETNKYKLIRKTIRRSRSGPSSKKTDRKSTRRQPNLVLIEGEKK
ncbi:hypothetical protein [Mesorhizobium sp. M0678]|uniref:hypothetical protein n=2 Tax=unclassified Mesorhizobium TaxID=325217 RepID=UPI003336B8A0